MFITQGINEKLAIVSLAVLACASANAQDDPCKQPSREAVRVITVDIHLEPRLADGRKLRLRGIEPLDADAACLPVLYQLESAAREARLGLWADPAYAVLDAADSAAFAQLAGKIVLAEGIVAGVGKWRTLSLINFGRGRRGEVSASLSRRVARAMETRGTPLAGLKGSRIRIRGPLQLRTSPRFEIFSADAIEIMSSPASKK